MVLISISVALTRHQLIHRYRPVHHMVCLFMPQLLPVPNYCLVIEAHGCEQLALGCYPIVPRPEIKLTTLESQVQHPNDYTTELTCRLVVIVSSLLFIIALIYCMRC